MCSSNTNTSAPPSSGPAASTPVCGSPPCPTPTVLEIVDRKTGAVVSGTSPTKIVGQKNELLVRSRPAGHTLTNIRWTVTAETVKNYTQSTSTGTRTDLSTADLQGTNLDFYWISGGSKSVQVTADVDGAPQSTSVTYNVLAPTGVSMTSVTGTVAASNPGFPTSGLELHYGTNVKPGIQWTLTATAPPGGGGEIAGTQTANPPHTRTTNAGVVESRKTGGNFLLDNSLPYAPSVPIAAGASATWTSDDTPGIPLTSNLRSVTGTFQGRLYFMYRPSGTDSIWVTLARLDWGWAGTTTRVGAPASTGNRWTPPTAVSDTPNPSGSASTELPTWTANLAGLGFTP
jgi:hypothetical protein